jgi:hypothetical protein
MSIRSLLNQDQDQDRDQVHFWSAANSVSFSRALWHPRLLSRARAESLSRWVRQADPFGPVKWWQLEVQVQAAVEEVEVVQSLPPFSIQDSPSAKKRQGPSIRQSFWLVTDSTR